MHDFSVIDACGVRWFTLLDWPSILLSCLKHDWRFM